MRNESDYVEEVTDEQVEASDVVNDMEIGPATVVRTADDDKTLVTQSVAEEQIDDEYDLSTIVEVNARAHNARSSTGRGAISIINTEHHGRRISFSPDVLEKIGNPETVQIALNKDGIFVGRELPSCNMYFPVKRKGTSAGIVYNTDLVKNIANNFSLDFNGRASRTFYKTKVIRNDNDILVLIYMQ